MDNLVLPQQILTSLLWSKAPSSGSAATVSTLAKKKKKKENSRYLSSLQYHQESLAIWQEVSQDAHQSEQKYEGIIESENNFPWRKAILLRDT